jgi:putative polyhydroxyalkanoate system protein
MADIDIKRAHNLGLKGARAAADKMAEHLGRRFDLQGDWEGNVLRFQRPGVTGSLAIGDQELRLSVALGFLLKAMKPSIEKAVEHELDSLFREPAPQRPARVKRAGAKPGKPAASRKKGR